MDDYVKRLIILTMQRLPSSEQKKLYEVTKIVYFLLIIIQRYFNSSSSPLELFYISPQKSKYPNGLYGVALEDRIFIHTIPCNDGNYHHRIANFEGCFLEKNERMSGKISKATEYGYKGKFDNSSDSVLKVIENGDKLIFNDKQN